MVRINEFVHDNRIFLKYYEKSKNIDEQTQIDETLHFL